MNQSTNEITPTGETGVNVSQMKKITVRVTQNDISNGNRRGPVTCPIARAIKRLLKPEYRVHVETTYIGIFPTDPDVRGHVIILPSIASDFINVYDDDRGVEPLSFNLEIPVEFLA